MNRILPTAGTQTQSHFEIAVLVDVLAVIMMMFMKMRPSVVTAKSGAGACTPVTRSSVHNALQLKTEKLTVKVSAKSFK